MKDQPKHICRVDAAVDQMTKSNRKDVPNHMEFEFIFLSYNIWRLQLNFSKTVSHFLISTVHTL